MGLQVKENSYEGRNKKTEKAKLHFNKAEKVGQEALTGCGRVSQAVRELICDLQAWPQKATQEEKAKRHPGPRGLAGGCRGRAAARQPPPGPPVSPPRLLHPRAPLAPA